MKLRIIEPTPMARQNTLRPSVNVNPQGSFTFSLSAVLSLGLKVDGNVDIVVDDESGEWYAVFQKLHPNHAPHKLLAKKKGKVIAKAGRAAMGFNHVTAAREILQHLKINEKKSITLPLQPKPVEHDGLKLYLLETRKPVLSNPEQLVARPQETAETTGFLSRLHKAQTEAGQKETPLPVTPEVVATQLPPAPEPKKPAPQPKAAPAPATVVKPAQATAETPAAPETPAGATGIKRPIATPADASDERLQQRREYLLNADNRNSSEAKELGKINKELQSRGISLTLEAF